MELSGVVSRKTARAGVRERQRVGAVYFRTVLDVPKPKYCGAPNLCEDLY